MNPVLRAAAERRYGAFTTREALTAGYTQSQIENLTASGRWVRLRRGVLVTAEDLDRARHEGYGFRLDCLAVLLGLGRLPTAVSHTSAAQLWGLPRPTDTDVPIRLSDPDRWRRGKGFVMSRAPLRRGDVGRMGPVRVTSAHRTLVDCAREWPLEDAVVAMDAALLASWTTAADLHTACAAAEGWPGASGAARAAKLADGRAESPLETRGRLRIIGSGFATPELQVEIHTEGRLVAVVDAWFEEAAVAVEFDGRVKYTTPWRDRSPDRVLWEEKRREDELRSLDIAVVRVVNADLGAHWPSTEQRLGRLLSTPGPRQRRFTTRARPAGRLRTG